MATWLAVEFHPGFAEDLTNWRTEIERTGRLSQTVNIRRFAPIEQRTEQHQSQLDPSQIQELEQLISRLDFPAIAEAAGRFSMDDAGTIAIVVDGSSATTVNGPLLYWKHTLKTGKAYDGPAVSDAIQLWEAIDRLSPHQLGTR